MSDSPNDRGLSRKHITESINHSLQRLGTDYVDLYQCHRYDEQTPLAETVRTMGDLIARGKILYWGTSSWPAASIRDACTLADELGVPRPISEQPRYNLLCREIEADVIPTCEELGIGLLYWSPLAQGYLTGKYRHGNAPPGDSRAASPRKVGTFLDDVLGSEEAWNRLQRIQQAADRGGVDLPALALSWCLQKTPSSAVLVGATKLSQMQQNLACNDFKWTDELREEIQTAVEGEALGL